MSDAPRVSDADLVKLLRTSYADAPMEWLQSGNVRGLLDSAADRLEALAARVTELEQDKGAASAAAPGGTTGTDVVPATAAPLSRIRELESLLKVGGASRGTPESAPPAERTEP